MFTKVQLCLHVLLAFTNCIHGSSNPTGKNWDSEPATVLTETPIVVFQSNAITEV